MAAAAADDVIIDTTEINFPRSTTDVDNNVEINMQNGSDDRVAFKVKSTQPTTFRMYPAYGYIEPHNVATVVIYSKPFNQKYDHHEERITILLAGAPMDYESHARKFWKDFTHDRRVTLPVEYAPLRESSEEEVTTDDEEG